MQLVRRKPDQERCSEEGSSRRDIESAHTHFFALKKRNKTADVLVSEKIE
jgi:hypothetical protein